MRILDGGKKDYYDYLTGIYGFDEAIVYDTDLIDISTEKRANWIKELYPNVEIKFAHNPPSQYGLDEESVNIQMKYLVDVLGDEKPTHFYSSEPYGKCVAEYMNIIDRRVKSIYSYYWNIVCCA